MLSSLIYYVCKTQLGFSLLQIFMVCGAMTFAAIYLSNSGCWQPVLDLANINPKKFAFPARLADKSLRASSAGGISRSSFLTFALFCSIPSVSKHGYPWCTRGVIRTKNTHIMANNNRRPSRKKPQIKVPETGAGYLEISDKGFGFLRSSDHNYQPKPSDIFVTDTIKPPPSAKAR